MLGGRSKLEDGIRPLTEQATGIEVGRYPEEWASSAMVCHCLSGFGDFIFFHPHIVFFSP